MKNPSNHVSDYATKKMKILKLAYEIFNSAEAILQGLESSKKNYT